MLFSIIVPVYNVEKYLNRCVESLLGQTFSDIEIILVDDESPDACPSMCDEYAKRDSRIKVIHKKNGGLSDARNAGLAVAQGQYILFLDSDDYFEVDACERFAVYSNEKSDILIGDAVVEGGNCSLRHISCAENTSFTGPQYLKQAHRAGKAPMAAWLNAYRREFLVENNLSFKFGILHEDEQFTPRAFLKAESVALTDVTFYHYIIREGSITTKKDKRKNAEDLFGTCCELEKIFREIADSELRALLLDSLVMKYLNIFQVAELYRYGRQYTHIDFLKRNAYRKKTRVKVLLLTFSPKIYFCINKAYKLI